MWHTSEVPYKHQAFYIGLYALNMSGGSVMGNGVTLFFWAPTGQGA
jgi:hypothetical protein